MHIPPNRRRRCLHAHYLAQRGRSQREIAKQLEVSRATVRSDLQLVETHWASIAAPAADDILLESLHLLNLRLSLAIKYDDVAADADRLSPVDYLRAREGREAQLNALAREIRRTAQDIHRRAEQRPDQPGLYDEEPQESAETSTKLTTSATPDPTISSPEQEIVADQPQEEKIAPETAHLPDPPDHDALINEAIDHFPHLKGQSTEQILTFLDQLTDPDRQYPEIPTPIHAEAAA
ncbi:MAG: HTH domain-containing protein [Chloroflexi bacterium]|nr:HTH domain-containing protein [Chloroflexota bacterium]